MKIITKHSLMLITAVFFIMTCSNPVGNSYERTLATFQSGNPRIVQIPVDTTNGLYLQIFYYPSGQIKASGYVQYNKVTGLWVNFHTNGVKRSEGYASMGRIQGLWTYYYPDGTIRKQGNWEDGHKTGTWYYWDENGQLINSIEY